MTTTAHPLAQDYLRRLDRAARVLPSRDRHELLEQIRGHLDAGLAPDSSEAEVRTLLDSLGPPEDIVAAAGPEQEARRRGVREVLALVLLVTGLPPVVGWLVGLALLVWSPLWTARQKLLGALVWPGGYVLSAGLLAVTAGRTSCAVVPAGGPADCTSTGQSPLALTATVLILLAPLVVAAYLYVAAGRRSGPA